MQNLMGLMEEQSIAARLATAALERFGNGYGLDLETKRIEIERALSHQRSNRPTHEYLQSGNWSDRPIRRNHRHHHTTGLMRAAHA
jgi:hypothetical protein